MIKTKPLLINLLLSLVALFLHGYLTQKFFDLQNGLASGQSLCNLNSVFNCDAVSTSRFAKFGGFPIALWAFMTHLIFIVAQVMVLLRQNTRDYWSQLSVGLSLFIAGASVVMGAISLTQLRTYCLFCLIAYGLSFLSLAMLKWAGLDFKAALGSTKDWLVNKTTLGLLIAIPVSVFVFGKNWGGNATDSRMQARIQDTIAAWEAAPVAQFDESAGLRMGSDPANTRVTLIEFADFRCPHCKHAAPTIKAFVQSRSDVALIFKPYPLDGTCNKAPVFKGEGDGISCRLAFAVQCSEKLNKEGWAMYSHIFEQQELYSQTRTLDEVDARLCDSGLVKDCQSFKDCLSADDTRIHVQKMAEEGTQAGIQGTPAFFLNKRSLPGGQFLPVLEAAETKLKSQSN